MSDAKLIALICTLVLMQVMSYQLIISLTEETSAAGYSFGICQSFVSGRYKGS